MDDEDVQLFQQLPRLDRTTADRHHGGLAAAAHVFDEPCLELAERRFALLLEELPDRSVRVLDLAVDVEEPAPEPPCDLRPERRLPGAHEPDEREVGVQRVLGCQSIRSRYALYAATKSPSASPPNFSRAARASSHATHASATTASASTAEVSLRSTRASPGSPVCRSTERRGRMSVGSGFIAARTTISSPFDTPASIPPARFVARRRSGSISSCAAEPRSSASANPSPISTPFTAWMPMSAAARRASRRVSFDAYEPRPGGTPRARTSTSPYFCTPARSAWPGRGRVTGFVPFPDGSPSGGQGLIPHSQFAWSRLRTTSASGVPSVRPWRRPASTSTVSDSIRCRGLRPYPSCRRRRSRSIASRSRTRPAGRPERIATRAGPCDSPAVTSESVTPGTAGRSRLPRIGRERAEDLADAVEAVRARRGRRGRAEPRGASAVGVVRGQVLRGAEQALALHVAGKAADALDPRDAAARLAGGVAAERLEARRHPPRLAAAAGAHRLRQ